MKAAHAILDETAIAVGTSLRCSRCGWPGIGRMPAGVRMIRRNGKDVLIGLLSYYRTSGALCSVCQEMESAVADRPWFIEAHAEYLNQIAIKKQLLGGR